MAKTKRSAKQLDRTFKEMDKCLLQAESDLKIFQDFIKLYKKMNDNMKVLEKYYHSDWMKDVEALEKQKSDNENYYCTNQDSIWNTSQDFYIEKIKLMKLFINSI